MTTAVEHRQPASKRPSDLNTTPLTTAVLLQLKETTP